tara:strand:+ start:1831 stop:1962 length:132 start_codon:yes stop_codon:yes gene_type:complete
LKPEYLRTGLGIKILNLIKIYALIIDKKKKRAYPTCLKGILKI